jgi:hypothetical protein
VAIVSSFLLQPIGGRGHESDTRGSEGMANGESQTRPAPSIELLNGNLANLLKIMTTRSKATGIFINLYDYECSIFVIAGSINTIGIVKLIYIDH